MIEKENIEKEHREGKHDLTPTSKMAILPLARETFWSL